MDLAFDSPNLSRREMGKRAQAFRDKRKKILETSGPALENQHGNSAPAQILLSLHAPIDCNQNVVTGFLGQPQQNSILLARIARFGKPSDRCD